MVEKTVEKTIEKVLEVLSIKEINMINIKIDEEIEKDVIYELIVDYCMFIDKEEDGTYNILKYDCYIKGEIEWNLETY